MVESIDYYEVLEIDPSASEKEVKESFRRLTKLYHPDKHSNSKQSHNKYMKIVEAFTVLSNKNSRTLYDSERKPKSSHRKSFKQESTNSSKSTKKDSFKKDYPNIFTYSSEQKADYLYDVGLSYLNAQIYDKSIQYFDLAIEQFPRKSTYYLYKGDVLMKMKMNKEALRCFESCLRIDPSNIIAIRNRNQLLNIIKGRVY